MWGQPRGWGVWGTALRGAVRPPEAWLVPGVRKHALIYLLISTKIGESRGAKPPLSAAWTRAQGAVLGSCTEAKKKGKKGRKWLRGLAPSPSGPCPAPGSRPCPAGCSTQGCSLHMSGSGPAARLSAW